MTRSRARGIGSCLAAIGLALALAGCALPSPVPTLVPIFTQLPVLRYHNETALDLLYPAHWVYAVVTKGLLVFGESDTIAGGKPGASLTVYRQSALAAPDTLQAALQDYLDRGPASTGYKTIGEARASQLGGREALEVFVESGAEASGDAPAMKGYIVLARASSGAVYVLTATAPKSAWDQAWPLFAIIIQSVQFN